MPWHTSDTEPACDGVAVIDDTDDSIESCHADESSALAHIAELETGGKPANKPEPEAANRFEALLAIEGWPTSDGRLFELNSLTWRDLPLPLMVQTENAIGHEGAFYGGQITEIMRDPEEPSRIMAAGQFDGPRGEEAMGYAMAGLRGISIDAGGEDVVLEVMETDDEGNPTAMLQRFGDARVMGATVTPFPAFEETVLWMAGEMPENIAQIIGEEVPHGEPMEVPMFLLASCADCDPGYRPAAHFFENPNFDGPQPIAVESSGRISGHIATWGTCHVGTQGTCVQPPRSRSSYAYFHTGELELDDDRTVAVGHLTYGAGHADIYADHRGAVAHYDNTATVVADVVAGEDRYGIWITGAIRPTVDAETRNAVRAAAPSGDWRPIGGSLELVAVLSVNVPGFPIPRARVASGEVRALVAAAAPRPNAMVQGLHERIRRLELQTELNTLDLRRRT